jgi:hypothetical protein
MPVTYEIDSQRRLIRTRCVGATTLEEVLEHFDTLQRDPRRPDHLDVILDLSAQVSLPEADQLRAVAARIMEVREISFGKLAVIVDRDSMFGMARMFEVFAETHFTASRVFRDGNEAERWVLSRPGSRLSPAGAALPSPVRAAAGAGEPRAFATVGWRFEAWLHDVSR